MSQYYVAYSGGHFVIADSEDEACKIAMNKMEMDKVDAYLVNECGKNFGGKHERRNGL